LQAGEPTAARAQTIRVALSDFRWPLDPALATTRDETTLARAMYATPLRTDRAGRVTPGLCSEWRAANGFRSWTFRCRNAGAIAAELRRVARMRASPERWMFAAAQKIAVSRPGTLVVRLRAPWRRFPYALTAISAAPRSLRGPFRVIRVSHNKVVLRHQDLTLVFRRLTPFRALQAFGRHELDEAPVPLGDVGRLRPPGLRVLHVRPLLAQDVVVFRDTRVPAAVRRSYWDTANRADYQALVAQNGATAALGVLGTPKADPGAFRRAVGRIASLPPVRVRISVPDDPTLQYGARLLYGQWREVGLGPQLVGVGRPADADLRRVMAPYPQDEAFLGALGHPAGLGAARQQAAFARVDAQIAADATVIPICWVADARLVSPKLAHWREDALGDVDYTQVRFR
jgi:hypothetical protein